ncbi:MAG: tetratricopeptide repeat protein [bacterium]|nr:tetratricopeptide repeat protein [bacterium]
MTEFQVDNQEHLGDGKHTSRIDSRKALGVIVLCACLFYGNTLPNELLFDDAELIPHQNGLRTPWDVGAIFSGRYWGALKKSDTLYRPLTVWSLSLNYGLNRVLGLPGVHPVGYHAVNVLLHAFAGCMVYVFCMKVGLAGGLGLAVALLFVAHPIHTEVVAGIVNRSEILALIFGLGFLILHRMQARRGRVALCYFLALCSKESAIAFLPLVVWTDVCFGFKDRRQTAVSYGMYAGILALWLGVRSQVVGGIVQEISELDNPIVTASFWEQILTAARVQFDYLKLQVIPVGLSSDYSYQQIPVVSTLLDGQVLGFIALMLGGIMAGLRLRRSHLFVLYSVVSYGILFVPTSNFFLVIGTIMGERLTYSPSVFFCLLLGYGVWMLSRSGLAWILACVILVFYGGLTVAQNRTWAHAGVFFETQVRSAPASAKAHNNLGRTRHAAGLLDQVLANYEQAIFLWPKYADAWNNLGVFYKAKADYASAVRAYRKSVSLKPNQALTYFNLGNLYHETGEVDQAVKAYLTVIRLSPHYFQAYVNLGVVYSNAGRMTEAEAIWKEVLQLDPKNTQARANLVVLEKRR